jgi:hypothetical protein
MLTAGAAKAPVNAEGCIPLPSFRVSAEKWSARIPPDRAFLSPGVPGFPQSLSP